VTKQPTGPRRRHSHVQPPTSALPRPAVLVLNAGSSSLKFAVFPATEALAPSVHGLVDGIGIEPRLTVGGGQAERVQAHDHPGAFDVVAGWLERHLDGAVPAAVGHRVVHGGWQFEGPARVDADVLAALTSLVPLAPLHQPQELAAIRSVAERWPDVPQVACFDTSFHRTRPELAQMFALPHDLFESGVRRYGFHGISYESIAGKLPAVAPEIADGRVVVAHLGNGASLCAMRGRRSVDTTMSFSALDGLPMGTRVGDLDPAVVLYLEQARGMTAEEVTTLLYTKSGLLGLSGVSSDVRVLSKSPDPRARLALDYFAYRVARETGALAVSLGGLDALVFTAGIGEHAADVRAAVCGHLGWLGVTIDPAANGRHGPRISTLDSAVSAWVIPTDEERAIAHELLRFI
jgi:acetate kinase